MRKNFFNLQALRTKKAVFILLLALILCASVIAGILINQNHEEQEVSLEQVLNEKQTAYETDLRDSLVSMENNEDVASYLLSWAKNKDITAVKDKAGNVIYVIPASETAKDAQPAAVLCSFDASNMENCVEEIAIAMTIARNAENHGNLQVIFLAEENGDKSGIQALSMSRFADGTAVFCLSKTASSHVAAVTGGYQKLKISKKLDYDEPSYNKAYKVTLKNCPSQLITGKYEYTLNPIKTLGSVLANFKSTSLLFELASFSGGSDANLAPSHAAMTVIINDSDTAKFQRKMDSSIESIYEKYGDVYPEIEYTYEEVDLPSRVITGEVTDNLVSLMYTSFNGVYNRDDEGNIVALSNIGRLSCKDSRLNMDIAVMCSDAAMLQEISEAYETICGLCDVKFKISEEHPVYDGTVNESTQQLLETFGQAFREFTGDSEMVTENTAVLTSCSFIQEADPNLPVLFCGVTENTKYKFAGSVITWLNQGTEEEKS